MSVIAKTPEPPYYAVIFSSIRSEDDKGYGEMADRMLLLAAEQEGFLGVESAREELGITVSYWADLESIKAWKANAEHRQAQALGHSRWYSHFTTRIAKVERDYGI
ncbi:antibiotic biosynthesis monooxygenase [uncultured Pseudoteredinibacter sp.]|uniref:antibiotic biosynthesis monooxygenase family protein n=1 Tax=uncultured Pseudoteredinibacter sp. TaxID=1641701 RepID=UPI0026384E7F|nr:antibiotic biosynthesis monooxygenase [uncultured Pseudoteredinibacter sp.]